LESPGKLEFFLYATAWEPWVLVDVVGLRFQFLCFPWKSYASYDYFERAKLTNTNLN